MRLPVWTRLEPEAAADDVGAGLAAPAADPAWLLARQWQVGELTAEDAASPVAVEVTWTQFPIDQIVLGGVARRFEATVPLEAILEPEPAVQPSWRTR
ncbi:MAG: hypothetical protein KBD62_29635, partial [Kofleriaceae bacterium]|nr:hypothetical protein [Kofleriaceae bacterium]